MHQLAANDDDEQLNNAEQIDIVNSPPYTNGAVEEADPDRYITPPIIRLATRPEQLRLSYMDELAPLTTTDQPLPLKESTVVLLLHTQKSPDPVHNEV